MAARTVTGIVSATPPGKDWTDRGGKNIKLYSFQLEGSNQWFRTGTTPIGAGVGQNVKFVADGANVDMESFSTVAATVAQAPTVPPTAAVTAIPTSNRQTSGTKDGYWDAKEARDIAKEERYQRIAEPRMALSVAVQAAAPIVAQAIASDALSFGNATKAKKVGILVAYTKEVALELAAFIQNAPQELETYKASLASSNVAQPTTNVPSGGVSE